MKEAAFFQDLAVLMVVSGLAAVIFTRLGWPKVIGYLLAGIIMSKHTWGGSFLADPQSIATIGQLGIVFLMFSLGLEFSASEMKRVKHVSVPTAIVDMAVMIWLGYTLGHNVLGWGMVPSLFLGAAISDSATTLLTKTIDEMHWGSRPFVRYVFGTTICEDILCVALIAVITGVAHGKGMSVTAALQSLGGLGVFFIVTLVAGLSFVPRFLNNVGKMRDSETLLLTLLGFCFLISFVAMRLDYSVAMGAFLVGILGASSNVRSRLNELAAPLRSMFSAVFFVAIGLLVDPGACWKYLGTILVLSLVVVIGKGLNCFVMSLVSGQRIKDAVQTGMGLAQIGEFAFMVAIMYVSITHDESNPMFPIVVGVSLLTTCLNPLMLRLSDPVGDWLEVHMPARISACLAAYRDWLARFQAARVPSHLRRLIHKRFAWVCVILVINGTVLCSAGHFARADWRQFVSWSPLVKQVVACVVADIFCLFTFIPLSHLAASLGRGVATVLTGSRRGSLAFKWKAAVGDLVQFVVRLAVIFAACVECLALNISILPDDRVARFAVVLVLILVAVFGWNRLKAAGIAAGFHFNEAITAERRLQGTQNGSAPTMMLTVPGDFYVQIEMTQDAYACGKSLRMLDVRARTGSSILSVKRDGKRVRNPAADWVFQAGDVIVAIGEPAQMAAVRKLLLTGNLPIT